MKTRHFWILIGGLVVLNGYSLYQNNQLYRTFNSFKDEVEPIVNRFEICKIMDCFNSRFLDDYIEDVTLLIVVPANNECNTCVDSNNRALTYVHRNGEELKNNLKIVLVGYSANVIERFSESGFNILALDEQDSIFKDGFLINYPVFSIIDKHNVFISHEIIADEVFYEERIRAFWDSASTFLAEIYGN